MSRKKAQAWGFDLMIASVIFSAAMLTFYLFAINNTDDSGEIIEKLSYDGDTIADAILSEGYPENWNPGNVIRIGLLSEGKINESKLENFYSLVQTDYNRTRILFNTQNNYYLNLSEPMNLLGGPIGFIGQKNENPKNLIRTTRIIIYKDRPIALYINVWN